MSVARRVGHDLDDRPAPFPYRRVSARQIVQAVRQGYGVARFVYGAAKRYRSQSAPPPSSGDRRDNKRIKQSGGPVKMTPSNATGSYTMKYKKKKKTVHPSLKKRVKSLEKKLKKQQWHKHTFKTNATVQVSSSANQAGYQSCIFWGTAQIEDFINAVPYMNPAAPATNAQFDATTIVPNVKWAIDCYGKVIMRNNYLYPCNVRCYIVKPKVQTGNLPEVTYLAGLTKMADPAVDSTSATVFYLTESEDFKLNWKVVRSCNMSLKSGDECVVPYKESIKYDQEFWDINTSAYNKPYTRICVIRVQGVVCHDSLTPTNVGWSPAKLDVVIERTFKMRKCSEAPLRTIEQTNGLQAITTAIVGVASAETENAL